MEEGWLNQRMQNPRIQRTDCTMPSYIRHLSIFEIWYPRVSWHQSSVDTQPWCMYFLGATLWNVVWHKVYLFYCLCSFIIFDSAFWTFLFVCMYGFFLRFIGLPEARSLICNSRKVYFSLVLTKMLMKCLLRLKKMYQYTSVETAFEPPRRQQIPSEKNDFMYFLNTF